MTDLATADGEAREGAGGLRPGMLLAATFGHAVSDGFANFVAPLMYTIRAMYGLADREVGLISLVFALSTNLAQPLFGYAVDRWRLRYTIPVAVLISAMFICGVGYAPNLHVFIGFLVLAGLGIALFHPRGGSLAAEASGSRRALGMSIFGAGGAVGYALASLAAPLLHTYGLQRGLQPLQGLVYALPVGLASAALLAYTGAQRPLQRGADTPRFSVRRSLLPRWREILPVFTVMSLRSGTVSAFATFFQVLQGERGEPALAQGGVLFSFVAGGAIGSMVFGHLSDRWGRRLTSVVTLALAPAMLWPSLHAGYLPALVLLFVGGFLLRGTESVNIAQTQDILPDGMSMASALSMGLVWAVAALAPAAVGIISDAVGGNLAYALSLTMVLPLGAAAVALVLPTRPPVATTAC